MAHRDAAAELEAGGGGNEQMRWREGRGGTTERGWRALMKLSRLESRCW